MQQRHPKPRWLEMPEVSYPMGNLCFGQQGHPFPFAPVRIFCTYGIPPEAVRGGHALRKTETGLFCMQGACTLWLFDPTGRECRFRLSHPTRGVFIPAMWWVELGEYLDNSITLAVASQPFEETDYIRNPERFFDDQPYPDPVSRPRG